MPRLGDSTFTRHKWTIMPLALSEPQVKRSTKRNPLHHIDRLICLSPEVLSL